MLRAALFATAVVGLALGLRSSQAGRWLADALRPVDANTRAFLELIGALEANGDYTIIAGGDHFSDFSEHPFIVNPGRVKKLGTTASGKYQQVVRTWTMARDALELPDFSPASQDKAAAWILEFKVPGTNNIQLEGTGNIELVRAGRFEEALAAYAPEWEALQKILEGRYSTTLEGALAIYEGNGGTNVA